MKRQALRASLWSAGDALSRQGFQFAATLVLARLLSPADFGVAAMLAVFVALAGVLADGGFSTALTQRQDTDHADESTVFWCNLALGIALAVALACLGPALAMFFNEPRLTMFAVLVAVAVLAGACGSIHFALLTKKLDFRTQAIAGGIGAIASGAIAITLALQGAGIWALATQIVSMAAITTLLLWCLHPWRPARVFRWSSVRKLGSFGGYHLASQLMETVYIRLYTLLIGKGLGSVPLGHYAFAENTRQLPASLMNSLVARVALPLFSRAQNNQQLLRRGMQFSIRVMMLGYAPAMLALAALAEPIVALLYGPQWGPAVPLLQVLALAGLLHPLHMINLHTLMAQGHARLMFRLELAKKATGIIFMLVGLQYGVLGLACSQLTHSLLGLWINVYYSRQLLGYGMLAQLRDAYPPILCSTIIIGAVAVLSQGWEAAPLPRLMVLGGLGGLAYLALMASMRTNAWRDAKGLVFPTSGSK